MGERGGAKVRLVRCPKCEKLLPELADYPVYRCGGCDATLQAKKLASVDGENIDEEPVNKIGNGKVFSHEVGTSLNEKEDLGSDDNIVCREKENFFHGKTAILKAKEVSDFYMNGRSHENRENFQDCCSGKVFGYSRFNGRGRNSLFGVSGEDRINGDICENEEVVIAQKSVEKMERSLEDTHGKGKVIDFHGLKSSTGGFPGKSSGFNSRVIVDSEEDNCEVVSRGHGNGVETEIVYGVGRFRVPPKASNKNLVSHGINDSHIDKVIQANLEGREIRGKFENFDEFQKFQQAQNRVELGGDGGFWGNNDGHHTRKHSAVQRNMQHWPHPNEGPSNNHESSYGYGGVVFGQDYCGYDRVEYLQQDRMALLAKLDELRDQLCKSCNVLEKPQEGIPSSSDYRHKWFAEGSSGSNKIPRQFLPRGNQVQGSTYFNHEPIFDVQPATPLMDSHDMDLPHFYTPKPVQNEGLVGDRDQFGARIIRTTSPPPQQYSGRPGFGGNHHQNNNIPKQYVDMDPEPITAYPHDGFYQQPRCSCLSCYNNQSQTQNQEIRNTPNADMFCHIRGPSSLGPLDYTGADAPSNSHESHLHMRRFRNPGSELIGLRKWHPQRSGHTKGAKRYCQPFAGGAPFIMCHNCFELLQIPKKSLLMNRNSHKLRCGVCSWVISFSIDGKRMVFSTPARNRDPAPIVDNSSGEMGVINHNTILDIGCSQGSFNSCSESEPIFSSPNVYDSGMQKELASAHNLEQMLGERKFNGSEKMQDYSSSSSSSEEDSDGSGSERDKPKSEELPLRADWTASTLNSPPHGRVGYSSSNELVKKFQKGSRSKRSDGAAAVVSAQGSFKQNSVKDANVATEMDFSDPGISQDSWEDSQEEDRPKIIKARESFFAGFIKKSLKEFVRGSQSSENGKCNVSVNGEPIPDRLVKKAAKQAGPIYPGHYWYDYRAGFWGVMGYHCLGIIPPYIEEFSYPIPKNCSDGNTGVLVNGRELHQKDLDLLAGRGLPTTRDKSYVIEISGTVMDEVSGEELDSLGKLAPTVERARHGFGMRVPRAFAVRKTPTTVSLDS